MYYSRGRYEVEWVSDNVLRTPPSCQPNAPGQLSRASATTESQQRDDERTDCDAFIEVFIISKHCCLLTLTTSWAVTGRNITASQTRVVQDYENQWYSTAPSHAPPAVLPRVYQSTRNPMTKSFASFRGLHPLIPPTPCHLENNATLAMLAPLPSSCITCSSEQRDT